MIAERISAHLKSNGIMQGHVADGIGVHRVTFSNMMAGKRRITAEEYVQICRVLEKPLDFFIDEEK